MRSNYSSKADMYSLGVVLVEMLGVSRGPDHTESERVHIIHAARERLEMPKSMVGRYPRLASLARSLLATDPADRPAARELLRSWVLPGSDSSASRRAGRSSLNGTAGAPRDTHKSVSSTLTQHLRAVNDFHRTQSVPSVMAAEMASHTSAPSSPASAPGVKEVPAPKSDVKALAGAGDVLSEDDKDAELERLREMVASLSSELDRVKTKSRGDAKSRDNGARS